MKMFSIVTQNGSLAFSVFKKDGPTKQVEVGMSRTPAQERCETMNARAMLLGIDARYELRDVA